MKMRATLISFATALAGCAIVETGDHVWYREGGSDREREAALAAAHTQAKQAHVEPAGERDIVIRAMTAQGWRMKPKASVPPLEMTPRQPAPTPQRPSAALL